MLPNAWWVLLSICSILGVVTWYMHNFTDREDLVKLFAFSGIATMLALVGWTMTLDV
ncbi:MAG: hypothetical protein QGF94_05185 [Candidatus Thalassarchaeaceae archaeon]|nr:hypothetical protein [Candidatus Thalassarchaeaceae archaeon]